MITVCPTCGSMRNAKGEELHALQTYSPVVLDLQCDACKERNDKPLTPREQARYWMREATYQRGRADAHRQQYEKVIELASKYGEYCRRCGYLEEETGSFLEWVSDGSARTPPPSLTPHAAQYRSAWPGSSVAGAQRYPPT